MIDVIELLNGIREKAFKDVDLTSLPKMSAEEKRTLVWENMERLLGVSDSNSILYSSSFSSHAGFFM